MRPYHVLINPRHEAIGYTGWPPESRAWKDVVPAVGAKLPAGAKVFLAADIEVTAAAGGEMSGARISYTVGDEKYEVTTKNSFKIGTCD